MDSCDYFLTSEDYLIMPKSPIIVLLGLKEPEIFNERFCPIIMQLNIVPWHGSQA